MRLQRVILAAGVAAVVALAGCSGASSGAKAAGNPPGPICEQTLDELRNAVEAAMWNRGMWNEKDPPPPVLLRPDGTPIAFSRIPQDLPPQETPAPSKMGAGQRYESLRQWKKAKKVYAAYHDYTATAGYDPIQDVLQAMSRVASESTVDCTKPGVGKPGAG